MYADYCRRWNVAYHGWDAVYRDASAISECDSMSRSQHHQLEVSLRSGLRRRFAIDDEIDFQP